MNKYVVKNIKKDTYIKKINLRGDYTDNIKYAEEFESREKASKIRYSNWDCPVPKTKE